MATEQDVFGIQVDVKGHLFDLDISWKPGLSGLMPELDSISVVPREDGDGIYSFYIAFDDGESAIFACPSLGKIDYYGNGEVFVEMNGDFSVINGSCIFNLNSFEQQIWEDDEAMRALVSGAKQFIQ